jgi:hypothetical protein
MNIFNMFSNKNYTETGNVLMSETGKSFVKVFNCYLSENNDLIQKQGESFMNMTTGVQSSFGDPFEDKE